MLHSEGMMVCSVIDLGLWCVWCEQAGGGNSDSFPLTVAHSRHNLGSDMLWLWAVVLEDQVAFYLTCELSVPRFGRLRCWIPLWDVFWLHARFMWDGMVLFKTRAGEMLIVF